MQFGDRRPVFEFLPSFRSVFGKTAAGSARPFCAEHRMDVIDRNNPSCSQ